MNDSILPQGAIIANISRPEQVIETSKTYKLDFDRGRILGLTNEIGALKQAIRLILSTERYEYLIYSWNYGSELKGVISSDKSIGESEFKRRIKEALLQDDRITTIDNFIFNYNKDSILVEFTVFSVFGEFETETVVSV